jgi:hypothetical protein
VTAEPTFFRRKLLYVHGRCVGICTITSFSQSKGGPSRRFVINAWTDVTSSTSSPSNQLIAHQNTYPRSPSLLHFSRSQTARVTTNTRYTQHTHTNTNTNMSLQGKVVFLTGASMGIGEACATALAAEGASLVLVSRSEVRYITRENVLIAHLIDRSLAG